MNQTEPAEDMVEKFRALLANGPIEDLLKAFVQVEKGRYMEGAVVELHDKLTESIALRLCVLTMKRAAQHKEPK